MPKERESRRVQHISYKLYLNTLRKTFNDMSLEDKGATFYQEVNDDNLKVIITIPVA